MKNFTLIILTLFFSHTVRANLLENMFMSESLLKFSINGKLSKNWKERDKNKRVYHKVNIISDKKSYSLQMKVRGNLRASYDIVNGHSYCTTPPLKIKRNESGKVYYFVSHCNDNETYKNTSQRKLIAGNNYLLREYIAYKIQNIMTKISPRVRLSK